MFVCFKGQVIVCLLPDRRVDICSGPQCHESPLWTSLRRHSVQRPGLNPVMDLKQDWYTLVSLTPYPQETWRLGCKDAQMWGDSDILTGRYLAWQNIPSPCGLPFILPPWLPSLAWVRRGDQRMLCWVCVGEVNEREYWIRSLCQSYGPSEGVGLISSDCVSMLGCWSAWLILLHCHLFLR